MKKYLFISWSGILSKSIAEELKLFFEETMQHVDPFFSPDIQKGTIWLEQINKAIDNSVVGILCLTPENYNKPWVLFESGALSRVGNVCPIVFNMEKNEIGSPISIFQSSDFNKTEFKKLFEDINKSSSGNLTQKIIDRIFENNGRYDKMEKKIFEFTENFKLIAIEESGNQILNTLEDINKKIDKILIKSSTSEIGIDYLDKLVTSFENLIDKSNSDFIKSHYSIFQNIINSIDFIVSEYNTNIEIPIITQKLEKMAIKIRNYS